jgi:hypothetical protein
MRKMYISKRTTVHGIKEILDILNNPNMETANLKRFMEKVYQPNWFQDTFGIFMPDDYKKTEELIAIFENTQTTENAKNAVKEIYKVAHVALKKAEKNLAKRKEDYDYYNKEYTEAKENPFFVLSPDASNSTTGDTTLKDKYDNSISYLKTAKEELALVRQGLTNM